MDKTDISASRLSAKDGIAHIALPFGPRTFWPERSLITDILSCVQSRDDIDISFATFHQVLLPYTYKCDSNPEEHYCRVLLDKVIDMIEAEFKLHVEGSWKNNVKKVSAKQMTSKIKLMCASKASSPDPILLFETGKFSIGLIASEAKSVNASLYTSMCQSVQMASDCALNMFKQHLLKYDEVVVPYITSAGFSIQFGAVYLMADCIPCAVTLSEALSVTDPNHILRIHRWIKALSYHCSRVITMALEASKSLKKKEIQFNDTNIYLKEKCVLKPACSTDEKCARSTMNYLLMVFYRLWNTVEARRYVHFPAGIMGYPSRGVLRDFISERLAWLGSASGRGSDHYQHCKIPGYPMLVFDQFEDDWKVAVHLRDDRSNREVIQKFLEQLKHALDAVKSAKIVHLDLKLSNVFYRVKNLPTEEPGVYVEVRIIDWDDCMFEGDQVDMVLYESMEGDIRYPQGDQFKIACTEYHDFFYHRIQEELTPVVDDEDEDEEVDDDVVEVANDEDEEEEDHDDEEEEEEHHDEDEEDEEEDDEAPKKKVRT